MQTKPVDYSHLLRTNILSADGREGALVDLCQALLKPDGVQKNINERPEDKITNEALKSIFRLIIILYAGENGILPGNQKKKLKEIIQSAISKAETSVSGISLKLLEIFREFYSICPSKLFNCRDDDLLDDILISEIIRKLTHYRGRSGEILSIVYDRIDIRQVGAIYEDLLDYHWHINENNGQVYFSGNRAKRRSSGSFFTPEIIISDMIGSSVGRKLDEIRTKADSVDSNRVAGKKALELKILDPAMGSGHFLIETAGYFSKRLMESTEQTKHSKDVPIDPWGWQRIIAEQCIYGVDKDPMVVELARLSLWLSVRGNYNTFTKIEKHLKTGDALTGPVDNHDTGGFNWSAEFPEVFRKDKGFDIIIGNPPYGNILKKDEKELATRHYSLIQNGTNKNIVLPFIQRSWALLKDGGCLTFIIPKAMIYVENWKRLRHFLINETDLFSITDNGQSFGSVLLEMVTFLTYKRKPDPKSKILTTRLYAGKYARYSYTDKYKLEKKYFTDQSFLISIDRNEIKRLYHFINRKSLPLEQITTIYRGLSVNNRLKIEYFDTSAPILRGRHLQPFKITGNSYVDKKYLNGFVPGNLLFQEIVAHIYTPAPHIRLIGCLNENSLPSVNTVTNIQLKTNSRFTPEFILGILQSEIINWYIYKFIYMNAFRTMHFSGSYARQVPVPDMPVKDIMSITEIVRQIHNHSLSAETGKNKIDRIVLDYYANDDLSAENINRLINEY